jgi:protein O-GlcNAc transferase
MATYPETLALAIQHHQAGNLQAAEQLYRQIVETAPNEPQAWRLLGVASVQLGRRQAAEECFRRAVALAPSWADAHNSLGNVLREQGRFGEAVACYHRALELNPTYAEAYNNLGNVLNDQERWDDAAACLRRAIELRPDYALAYNNLGIALGYVGKHDDAVACFRRAIELRPDNAFAHNNLGNTLRDQGQAVEAAASYRRALKLQPNFAEAHGNLGTALQDQGELDEAIACFRRALELRPDFAAVRSNLLLALQYRPGVTLAELAAAHGEYDRAHAAPLQSTWRPHENARDRATAAGRSRPLRVGFVSPDLGRHAVGSFLIRLLENLDRGQCAAVCYSDRKIKDDMTTRIQAAATMWRDAIGLSDEQLAEQIRADRIDVLFDLAGHTAGNRLLAFARKPAPVQVTWCGYAGTTGLAAMDYILADRCTIPAGSESFYRERVLRMPDGFLCFEPPDEAPPVSPLPAMDGGCPTFAAFHNPPKITPRVVEVWARVLERVPAARLLLKYRGMDDPATMGRLTSAFAGRGIDPARLEFRGFSAPRERFADYHRVDVALDGFPYGGCTMTCEALWMGVPVVTLPGETFASRCSLSHLSNVGLTETIASNEDHYVEIAVSLAADLPRLAALRAGLRERMAASPLCDGRRFAENFTKLLRSVWQE